MQTHFFVKIFGFFVLTCGGYSVAVGQTVEVIHSFDGTNGAYPESSLVLSSNGNFYGVTEMGGASNLGSIFEINPDGDFRSLISFNGTNGSTPRGSLLESTDGFLYGTTSSGGASGKGTVFKMTTNGSLTTLYSFDGVSGSVPRAGLAEGTNGEFYGTTFGPIGAKQSGSLFRITRQGILTTLKAFQTTEADGKAFYSGLTLGPDGNFYGVDEQVGGFPPNNNGTIYRVTHEGDFNVVFRFDGTNGRSPVARLVLGNDGKFYGSTSAGGTNHYGTLFQFTTDGQLTTLFTLADGSNTGIGETPDTELLREDNGDIYGLTHYPVAIGGGWGSIFKLENNGTISCLYSFDTSSGPKRRAGLIRGSDGNFYAQSPSGGAFGKGYIYRLLMSPKLKWEKTMEGLVFSWPTNFAGFTLQWKPALISTNAWIDSAESPTVYGSEFVVTNAVAGEARFYRLMK